MRNVRSRRFPSIASRLAGGEPLERRDLLTVAPEMLANVGLTEYPDAWSSPAEFTQLGGLTLFAASSQDGRELWRSDGTAAGTQQVLNINPSYYSSDPDQLTRLGDRVYFTAFADPFGRELWQTDGAAAGTKLVVDLATNASAQPQELTVWGTRLAFTAETKALGRELYVYDPAANKTSLVADLQPGLIGSVPSGLTVFGDQLLFVADDGVHGRELWAASPAGSVQLLQDLHPGAAHAFPATLGAAPLAVVGEWAYFAADDGIHGTELWRTNGLPGGANLVADLLEGPDSASPRSLTPVAGGLAFRANDGAHGTELWFTTGEAAGTRLVADIAPGTPTSAGRDLLSVGSNLYFVADDGVHGLEVWVSNLTTVGTRMVADIAAGAENARPEQLVAWNGAVYFTAQTSSLGRELWRTDGSTAGTVNVADLNPGGADGVERVALAGDRLWLAANDGVAGQEPWTLAADAQTPTLVSDIGKRRVQSGRYLDGFVAAGDYVYFAALNSVSGAELWKTGGTPETTELLVDLAPGSDGAAPESLTEYRGLLYFTAYDAVKGRQLWQTDGSAAGTQLVFDLPVNAAPRELKVANGQLFFVADENGAAELWRLDRRVDLLALPVKLQPQESPLSQVTQLTSAAGLLYFVAHTEARGTEVWSTDGNVGSMRNVVYSVAQPAGGELRLLAATGPSLFFLQQTPAGANLWQTDALGASAFLQVDAADASRPRIDLPTTRFVASGSHLYFTASNEFTGEELWRTTSPLGTNKVGIVADINPGVAGSQPTELTTLGDEVFFVANDGVRGPAIWRTNGEFGGTSLVVDVDPSKSTGDQPAQLTAVDHWLYFTATNRTLGVELWRTDVLGSGADRVADLWPGDQSSRPLDLSYLGGSLYFSALTSGLERMPFVLSYATPLPGDANFDGSVNLSDFGVLKAHFGEPGSHEDGDFNADGRIDLSDFGILKQNFGAVWQAATPTAAVAETEVEAVRSTPAAAASLLPAAAWSVAADALFANLGSESDRAPEEPF